MRPAYVDSDASVLVQGWQGEQQHGMACTSARRSLVPLFLEAWARGGHLVPAPEMEAAGLISHHSVPPPACDMLYRMPLKSGHARGRCCVPADVRQLRPTPIVLAAMVSFKLDSLARGGASLRNAMPRKLALSSSSH